MFLNPRQNGRFGWMTLLVLALAGGSGCDWPATSKESRAVSPSGKASEGEGRGPRSLAKGPALKLDLTASSAINRADEQTASIRFRDASEASGITARQESGKDAHRYFPTANGSGVALLDYDGDGWLDVYLATTRNLPLDAPSGSGGNRLYRNKGDGTFEDVTERAGVGFQGFTHGLISGDLDRNGHPDLVLTNLGPNVVYLNQGDGTFRQVNNPFGDAQPSWSSGSALLDYDGDGRLDLYISCYGEWTLENNEECGDPSRGVRTYCSPLRIRPARHYLYRGRGDGTFEETTASAGVLRSDGRGMGVLAIDVNLDGRIDLWVANDLCPKFLFLNKGDGTFEDISELSGASAKDDGSNQAGMGVDGEDLDGDGLPELFSTHFQDDYNTLYRNLDGQNFQDMTALSGTAQDCIPDVGWGCAFSDFDLDGQPDLFVVNGHVDDNLHLLGVDSPQPEKAKVWKNVGGLRFLIASSPGPYFEQPYVGRGAAFGDLDNDGDVDVVISRMDERPAVLINESDRGHWIGLKLKGSVSNLDAIGARVSVSFGDRVIHRQVKGGSSYFSSNDRRLQVGVGGAERIDRVEIDWPSGRKSRLEAPAIDRYHVVEEPAASDSVSTTWRESRLERGEGEE